MAFFMSRRYSGLTTAFKFNQHYRTKQLAKPNYSFEKRQKEIAKKKKKEEKLREKAARKEQAAAVQGDQVDPTQPE